jgi:hypothetical protein
VGAQSVNVVIWGSTLWDRLEEEQAKPAMIRCVYFDEINAVDQRVRMGQNVGPPALLVLANWSLLLAHSLRSDSGPDISG